METEPVPVTADERERFQAAMNRMLAAFLELKEQLDKINGFMVSTTQAYGAFSGAYQDAKHVFGTVLLQRDIRAGKDGGVR